MCGIAGLFLKNEALHDDLGRLTGLMMREMCDRGPDSAGFAIYGGETGGETKICVVARDGAIDWNAAARRLGDAIGAEVAVETLKDHAIFRTTGRGDTARNWLIDNVPGAIVLSQGQSIEIFKGVGNPSRDHRRPRADAALRLARDRPHPHGDRVRRDGCGLASVLDRERHLPRAQRLALEPQPPARAACAAGRALPDRQRQRGGGGLSRVAHSRRRYARARAGALPRRSRRLLHVRGRHARRLRGAARSDRVQAGRDGRDRRLGRDGDGVSRDRAAARRRATRSIWEPAPATVYAWNQAA